MGRGDTCATRECLVRYGGLVWSLARKLSASQADAEDAVQEIFLDVWKSAARYDESLGTEATFVAMIARRRLVDRRRRAVRHLPPQVFHEAPPQWAVIPQELAAEAAIATRVLGTLREEQRHVLALSCHGFSHEEVAACTGMPLGTVKAHARRGLIAIRRALDENRAAGMTARMAKSA